jgi:2-polyprenyl-3-methyl-5-hydroxy-6-metoxy-1,4-benzoquinol methylase
MQDAVQRLSAEIEGQHWWHVGRRRVLRGVLASLHLRPGARILDFGAGVGGNFALLREFGSVVALEPSLEAQRIAADTAPDVPYVSRLEDLPANASFDAVVMLDVLEHLDARPQVLRAIGERIGVDVPLVVTVPAYPRLFGEHDRCLGHKLRYTRRALRAELAAGGSPSPRRVG